MPDLLYEKHENYAIFTLKRPDPLNALGGALHGEFADAVADFDADHAMRAGIVTGAGRAFCAGTDLKEAADRASRGVHVGGRAFDGSVPRSFLQSSPKPFMAAVNGLAIGGGLETALQCDIRIRSSDAYFGLFEPRRGILPGPGAHYLPRFIPAAAANYVLLTGDSVSTEQALNWGIVSEVMEPDRLMPRAAETAQLITSNAPCPFAV